MEKHECEYYKDTKTSSCQRPVVGQLRLGELPLFWLCLRHLATAVRDAREEEFGPPIICESCRKTLGARVRNPYSADIFHEVREVVLCRGCEDERGAAI